MSPSEEAHIKALKDTDEALARFGINNRILVSYDDNEKYFQRLLGPLHHQLMSLLSSEFGKHDVSPTHKLVASVSLFSQLLDSFMQENFNVRDDIKAFRYFLAFMGECYQAVLEKHNPQA